MNAILQSLGCVWISRPHVTNWMLLVCWLFYCCSFIFCRHLSFFRESFRQLGVQQPSQQLLQSSTDGCCSTAIPFNRQTTIECFEVRVLEWSGRGMIRAPLLQRLQSCPAKRPRLRRQTHGAATEGLMGGARKGGGRSKRVREKEEAVEPEETTLSVSIAMISLLYSLSFLL